MLNSAAEAIKASYGLPNVEMAPAVKTGGTIRLTPIYTPSLTDSH